MVAQETHPCNRTISDCDAMWGNESHGRPPACRMLRLHGGIVWTGGQAFVISQPRKAPSTWPSRIAATHPAKQAC